MAVIQNEHWYFPPNITASKVRTSSVHIPKLHESSFSSQAVLKKRHQVHQGSGGNSRFGVDRALKSRRDLKCETFCRNQICMTNELAYL